LIHSLERDLENKPKIKGREITSDFLYENIHDIIDNLEDNPLWTLPVGMCLKLCADGGASTIRFERYVCVNGMDKWFVSIWYEHKEFIEFSRPATGSHEDLETAIRLAIVDFFY
jgi:hypothetical protein